MINLKGLENLGDQAIRKKLFLMGMRAALRPKSSGLTAEQLRQAFGSHPRSTSGLGLRDESIGITTRGTRKPKTTFS